MKKRSVFLMVNLLFLLFISAEASAVPDLQLYSSGAVYDTTSETWIIGSGSFTLLVIGANQNIADVKLSAAVPEGGTGNIDVVGYSWNFYPHSTPVMGDGSSLPPHGIFPTDFYEFHLGDFIVSSTTKVGDYTNSSTPGLPATADGYILSLNVAITGFSEVHFDAYDHIYRTNDKIAYVNAPFSHDAETGGGNPVPEPATMLLLGSGLVGFAAFSRNKMFKK